MFVTGESPTEDELVDSMAARVRARSPAQQHHYSNLAFALLGQVVARTAGPPYTDYVDERIIGPLGPRAHDVGAARRRRRRATSSTSTRAPSGLEPETDMAATACGRQLWSTVEDLCRWASFLAERRTTTCSTRRRVEEMWFPQVMYYPDDWILGWGLGLMLYNQRRRASTAATAVRWRATSQASSSTARRRSARAALTNSGTRGDMELFAIELAAKDDRALAAGDRAVAARGRSRRPTCAALLGRWWSEGSEFVFWWEDGALQAKVVGIAARP